MVQYSQVSLQLSQMTQQPLYVPEMAGAFPNSTTYHKRLRPHYTCLLTSYKEIWNSPCQRPVTLTADALLLATYPDC
jgi:hypothetical protein